MRVKMRSYIDPEYTAVNTPQQSHLAELSFHILGNRWRALMHRANLPLKIRYTLFREAITTVTHLDWISVITLNGIGKTRYQHWSEKNKDLSFAKYLRTWGEAGTVKTRRVTTSKIEERGTTCMLVGYAINHDSGVYRMWNETTNRVIVSRDVIWLKRMYFLQPTVVPDIINEPTFTNEVWEGTDNDGDEGNVDPLIAESREEPEDETTDDEENHSEESETDDIENENEVNEPNPPEASRNVTTTRSGREIRPPSRLIEEIGNVTNAERNYLAQIIMMQDDIYRAKQNNIVCMALIKDEEEYELVGVGNNFENTAELKVMKYDEAMNSKDRKYWINAVDKEHDRMIPPDQRKAPVWVVVLRKDLPPGAKVTTTTWAMKKKSNGTF